MQQAIRVVMKDGLGFYSGYINPAAYSCVIYLRVPENWLQDGELLPDKKEAILEHMYGKTWREGNGDGSYYVVFSYDAKPLSQEEEQNRVWMNSRRDDPDYRYWFYHVSETGEFQNAQSETF